MKKFISLMLVCIFAVSLSACGELKDSVEETPAATYPKGYAGETYTNDVTETPTEVENDSVEIVTEVTEGEAVPTDEETAPTESSPTSVDPGEIDISNALEVTSADSPAKLGEWIKSTRYSSVSKEYETIYWRVIDTTFDCQEDIDRYNGENHIYEFTPLENDDLAYCKVTYQVYFPKEFSANEWGISSSNLSLYAKNPSGGGIKWKGVAYIGLGQCMDITEESKCTLMPGDVFTGESIYVMVNDPSIEYVFEYTHNAEGSNGEMLYDYSNYR